MLKRLLRWFIRTVLMMSQWCLFAIVIVSQYLSHRYKPGSVLVLTTRRAGGRARHTNPLG